MDVDKKNKKRGSERRDVILRMVLFEIYLFYRWKIIIRNGYEYRNIMCKVIRFSISRELCGRIVFRERGAEIVQSSSLKWSPA